MEVCRARVVRTRLRRRSVLLLLLEERKEREFEAAGEFERAHICIARGRPRVACATSRPRARCALPLRPVASSVGLFAER